MLPAIMYAGSVALNYIGQNQADDAQVASERRNAAYYREQEAFSIQEMLRGLEVFDHKTTELKGMQMIHAGSQGTAITGLTRDVLAYESVKMSQERGFMQRQGEFKTRMFELKAHQSDQAADALNDPTHRLVSAATAGLSIASTFKST